MAKILDGKWLAGAIRAGFAEETKRLSGAIGRQPGLGVILVGDNPASHTYVASKERAARECGFATFDVRLPADTDRASLEQAIRQFNEREDVDGILLQLPLPDRLPSRELLDLISPAKDVDGLHPTSQGLLMRDEGTLRPCTPLGAMLLLDLAYSNINPGDPLPAGGIPEASLAGKRAVVVGRSLLVGKPVSLMLLARNATVTMAHSKSPDLPAICRAADIVVAAVGVPELVRGSWISEGAVVIDVGINRLPNGKLTGDVCYEEVAPKCAAVTPVPGGVGPLTVAMLMHNTLRSFAARLR